MELHPYSQVVNILQPAKALKRYAIMLYVLCILSVVTTSCWEGTTTPLVLGPVRDYPQSEVGRYELTVDLTGPTVMDSNALEITVYRAGSGVPVGETEIIGFTNEGNLRVNFLGSMLEAGPNKLIMVVMRENERPVSSEEFQINIPLIPGPVSVRPGSEAGQFVLTFDLQNGTVEDANALNVTVQRAGETVGETEVFDIVRRKNVSVNFRGSMLEADQYYLDVLVKRGDEEAVKSPKQITVNIPLILSPVTVLNETETNTVSPLKLSFEIQNETVEDPNNLSVAVERAGQTVEKIEGVKIDKEKTVIFVINKSTYNAGRNNLTLIVEKDKKKQGSKEFEIDVPLVLSPVSVNAGSKAGEFTLSFELQNGTVEDSNTLDVIVQHGGETVGETKFVNSVKRKTVNISFNGSSLKAGRYDDLTLVAQLGDAKSTPSTISEVDIPLIPGPVSVNPGSKAGQFVLSLDLQNGTVEESNILNVSVQQAGQTVGDTKFVNVAKRETVNVAFNGSALKAGQYDDLALVVQLGDEEFLQSKIAEIDIPLIPGSVSVTPGSKAGEFVLSFELLNGILENQDVLNVTVQQAGQTVGETKFVDNVNQKSIQVDFNGSTLQAGQHNDLTLSVQVNDGKPVQSKIPKLDIPIIFSTFLTRPGLKPGQYSLIANLKNAIVKDPHVTIQKAGSEVGSVEIVEIPNEKTIVINFDGSTLPAGQHTGLTLVLEQNSMKSEPEEFSIEILAPVQKRATYWIFLTIALILSSLISTYIGYAFTHRRQKERIGDKNSKKVKLQSGSEDTLNGLSINNLELAGSKLDKLDKRDREKNLKRTFILRHVEISNVTFFGDISWKCQPRMNVILGRNGYGKTYLLRHVAALLQKNREESAVLLSNDKSNSSIFLEFNDKMRHDHPDRGNRISRSSSHFEESPGPLPILAIPCVRYADSSQITVSAPGGDEFNNLTRYGAYHFLEGLPYTSIVNALFYQMGFDFIEGQNRLKRLLGISTKHERPQLFGFLEEVVAKLTEYEFRFVDPERRGGSGFEILVRAEGTHEPIPIQCASQGILSILAMFGLIHSYLGLLPQKETKKIKDRQAVVIIDEIDAHLHPYWQQKILGLLRETFIAVQFFISSHSPLIVAGCRNGEVSLLRPSNSLADQQHESERISPSDSEEKKEKFELHVFGGNFIGHSAEDILRMIFEIEEFDSTYTDFIHREGEVSELEEKIEELRSSKGPKEEIIELENTLGYIQDALEQEESRLTSEKILRGNKSLYRENKRLHKEIKRLRTRLGNIDDEITKKND